MLIRMLLWTLLGCSENRLFRQAVDEVVIPEDTAGGQRMPDECGEEAAPYAVEIDAECADERATPDWDLEVIAALDPEGMGHRLSTGRFHDTDGDGDIDGDDEQQVWAHLNTARLITADGQVGVTLLEGVWRSAGTVVDADPEHPGDELVVSSYRNASDHDDVSLLGSSGRRWNTPVSAHSIDEPWVSDLDGDGSPELLVGSEVLDASTGTHLFSVLEPMVATWAADLDVDGQPEILALGRELGLVFLSGGGESEAVCPVTTTWHGTVAIGDLDEDGLGEVVVASDRTLAVCDTDGSLVAEVSTPIEQPVLVGLAELDGTAGPEIIVSGYSWLQVRQPDLSLEWANGDGGGWRPFSVADLDGDGVHEVVVRDHQHLRVYRGDGELLVELPVQDGASWRGQPVVVDLDSDGSAEILVPGREPAVSIVSTPSGGWDIPGADAPWPGIDKHPLDRDVGGAVGDDAWWLESNVWQGHAAKARGLASPFVRIDSVCAVDCDSAVVVTVVVGERSLDPAAEVELVLRTAGGELLGRRAVEVAPGVAEPHIFAAAVEDATGGLVATLEVADQELCSSAIVEATWEGAICE